MIPMPPPIVKCLAVDREVVERIDRYCRDLARLEGLVGAIDMDRISNRYRSGGWFSAPPPPIPTEHREIEALRMARELEAEYAEIARLVPVASSLAAPLSYPAHIAPLSAPEGT